MWIDKTAEPYVLNGTTDNFSDINNNEDISSKR